MANHRNVRVRKEIQDYLPCCEYLLSTAFSATSVGLSEDEEGIVEYYAIELSKLRPRQRSRVDYRRSVLEYIRFSEALLNVDTLSDREYERVQQMVKQVVGTLLKPDARRRVRASRSGGA